MLFCAYLGEASVAGVVLNLSILCLGFFGLEVAGVVLGLSITCLGFSELESSMLLLQSVHMLQLLCILVSLPGWQRLVDKASDTMVSLGDSYTLVLVS